MTTIVALLLASMYYGLKPRVEMNEAVYNKKSTLTALNSYLEKPVSEMEDAEILDVFKNQIQQKVVDVNGNELSKEDIISRGYVGGNAESINMSNERKKAFEERIWPVYEYSSKGGEKLYVVALRGLGLWDEIWGVVALKDDLKTIAGVAFDHKAETPGLGAEIKDSKAFQESFIGKKIRNEAGEYRGIDVVKGGARNDEYEVDGISGATITADGVAKMFDTGVDAYDSYFKKIRK